VVRFVEDVDGEYDSVTKRADGKKAKLMRETSAADLAKHKGSLSFDRLSKSWASRASERLRVLPDGQGRPFGRHMFTAPFVMPQTSISITV
jgi:hypothetical protein